MFWRVCYLTTNRRPESIQVSVLAGRILFKGFRYYGANEHVSIVSGHITWRYWYRRVKSNRYEIKSVAHGILPCRLIAELDGLEWFIYNRTSAYDDLAMNLRERHNGSSASRCDEATDTSSLTLTHRVLKRILPLQINIKRGAVVFGNSTTPSVLVASCRRGSCIVAIDSAKSPLDLYRLSIRSRLEEFKLRIHKNVDYAGNSAAVPLPAASKYQKLRAKIMRLIPLSVAYPQKRRATLRQTRLKSMIEMQTWPGLSRYVDGEVNAEVEGHPEYAKVSTLLDAKVFHFVHYHDTPGPCELVSSGHVDRDLKGSQYLQDTCLPEWIIEMRVEEGLFTYGPWADRQRDALQHIFFPAAYVERESSSSELQNSRWRVNESLRVLVECDTKSMVRIPLREFSKDWQYSDGPKSRPYGWFDLKFDGLSTFELSIDTLGAGGVFRNHLSFDTNQVEIFSSVNHTQLLTISSLKVKATSAAPIHWRDLHKWKYSFQFNEAALFLLRDHVYLLSDLISDWVSGSSPAYETFTPYLYDFSAEFYKFQVFLNLNDGNIIDNATQITENVLFGLRGDKLHTALVLNLEHIAPLQRGIPFTVDVPNADIVLYHPSWNTYSYFHPSERVGTVQSLKLNGEYNVGQAGDLSGINSLIINAAIASLDGCIHGYLIRHLFNIKRNYFGDRSHFATLEEYQQTLSRGDVDHNTRAEHSEEAENNLLDVRFFVDITKADILLPENIYADHSGLLLQLERVVVDGRINDYYMDLQANTNPCIGIPLKAMKLSTDEKIYFQNWSLYAHRMLGNPPDNPTYVCNWDVDIGKVDAQITMPTIHSLVTMLQAFLYTFNDLANKLSEFEIADYDITFLRFNFSEIGIEIASSTCKVLFALGPSNVRVDKRANMLSSGRTTFTMGDLQLSILRDQLICFSMQSCGKILLFERKLSLNDFRTKQYLHVTNQDLNFDRLPGKQKPEYEDLFQMALPKMPPVLHGEKRRSLLLT